MKENNFEQPAGNDGENQEQKINDLVNEGYGLLQQIQVMGANDSEISTVEDILKTITAWPHSVEETSKAINRIKSILESKQAYH